MFPSWHTRDPRTGRGNHKAHILGHSSWIQTHISCDTWQEDISCRPRPLVQACEYLKTCMHLKSAHRFKLRVNVISNYQRVNLKLVKWAVLFYGMLTIQSFRTNYHVTWSRNMEGACIDVLSPPKIKSLHFNEWEQVLCKVDKMYHTSNVRMGCDKYSIFVIAIQTKERIQQTQLHKKCKEIYMIQLIQSAKSTSFTF